MPGMENEDKAASFNSSVHDAVCELLHKANRPPFLFVGSGISRRYIGTPDWSGLLESVCDGFDFMAPYGQYLALARDMHRDGGNNEIYPQAATLMERDFIARLNDTEAGRAWWDAHQERITRDGIPAMKLFLAEHLSGMRSHLNDDELAILRASTKNVGGVITTNYDLLMEDVFPTFETYSRQSDLIFSPITEVGEIYKIHGSMDAPETMVLDMADYESLATEQEYMLAKIMTVFAEYPIIFLGYSLHDQDVSSVLATIARCAGQDRAGELSERFMFVEYETNQNKHRIIDKDHGNGIEMKTVFTDDFTPIYTAIRDTPQRYAPKMLRQIRQHLYEAAYSDDEAMKAMLAPLENMDELPQEPPLVVGIAKVGYGKLIKVDDLYKDMLLQTEKFPVDLVVDEYLDNFLKQGGAPFYYYISRYKGELDENVRKQIEKEHCFLSYITKTEKERKESWRKQLPDKSVHGLVEKFGEVAYAHVTVLEEDEIDVNELEILLKDTATGFREKQISYNSRFRKSLRILDFLKYGKPYLKNSAPLQQPPSAHLSIGEPDGGAGVSPRPAQNHA